MAKYPLNIFVDFIDRAVVEVYERKFGIQYSLLVDNMDSHSEKTVTVVLLHPGEAEQFQSDPLMNQMIRFLSKEDFQNICFVSLFPYRVKTTNDLRDLIIDEDLSDFIELNSTIIRKKLKQSDQFILSWGDRPHYIPERKFNSAIQYIEQLIASPALQQKAHIFRYSHAPSRTAKGNPDTPYKKVIESLESYKKIEQQQKR